MPTATETAGKLLSASVCAYYVQSNGDYVPNPAEPYDRTVGWVGQPKTIVAGNEEINACLVGRALDGMVVAFRGTLPPNLNDLRTLVDWLMDFDADPLDPGEMFPGKVHCGFWEDLGSMWGDIVAAVKTLQAEAGGDLPLYITGHSKGGALSALAAMCFATGYQIPAIRPKAIHTFASARAGDAEFAAAYEKTVGPVHLRWEYADDVVPHAPMHPDYVAMLKDIPFLGAELRELKGWDYTSVGTLWFIDWDRQIVAESPTLDNERRVRLLAKVVSLRIAELAADHNPRLGGGYMTAVIPNIGQ